MKRKSTPHRDGLLSVKLTAVAFISGAWLASTPENRRKIEGELRKFGDALSSAERVDSALTKAGPELVAQADQALRDHEKRRELMGIRERRMPFDQCIHGMSLGSLCILCIAEKSK